MSVLATTWAWQQATESSGQRLVLLALADAAGGDEDDPRICWPSVGRIAKLVDLSDPMVRKHMERLVEMELISKVERRRRHDGSLGTWTITVNFTTAHPRAVGDEATAHPRAVDHRSPSSALEPSCSEPPEDTVRALVEQAFEAWWSLYPHKVGKKRAFITWKNLKRSDRLAAMSGLVDWSRFWRDDDTEMRFIPHPTTWLRDARWEATPPPLSRAKRTTGLNGLGLTPEMIEMLENTPLPTRAEMEAERDRREDEALAAREAAWKELKP